MVSFTAINVREPIRTAALMSKLIVRYALCIMNYALTIVHYALKICSSVLLSFPTLSRIPIPHSSFPISHFQFLTPHWVECRWLCHRGLPFRQHPLRHHPEPLRGFLTPNFQLCIMHWKCVLMSSPDVPLFPFS